MFRSVSLFRLENEQRKHGGDNDNRERHHKNGEREDGSCPDRQNSGAIHPQLLATPRQSARNLREPFHDNKMGWEARVPPARPQKGQNMTCCRGQQPRLRAAK